MLPASRPRGSRFPPVGLSVLIWKSWSIPDTSYGHGEAESGRGVKTRGLWRARRGCHRLGRRGPPPRADVKPVPPSRYLYVY